MNSLRYLIRLQILLPPAPGPHFTSTTGPKWQVDSLRIDEPAHGCAKAPVFSPMLERLEQVALATGEAIEGSISRPHNFRPDSPAHAEEMSKEARLFQRKAEVGGWEFYCQCPLTTFNDLAYF